MLRSQTNPLVLLAVCSTYFTIKPFQLPGKRLPPRSRDYLQNNRTVAQEQTFATKLILVRLVLHSEYIEYVLIWQARKSFQPREKQGKDKSLPITTTTIHTIKCNNYNNLIKINTETSTGLQPLYKDSHRVYTAHTTYALVPSRELESVYIHTSDEFLRGFGSV